MPTVIKVHTKIIHSRIIVRAKNAITATELLKKLESRDGELTSVPHVKNNMIIGFTEFIESVEPQIDITKMNQKLIFPGGGCRSLRDYDNGNKPPIIMARIVAQTLGPNHQGGIAQAVQADYKYLNQEVMKEI